jgi:hypothetical protein
VGETADPTFTDFHVLSYCTRKNRMKPTITRHVLRTSYDDVVEVVLDEETGRLRVLHYNGEPDFEGRERDRELNQWLDDLARDFAHRYKQ